MPKYKILTIALLSIFTGQTFAQDVQEHHTYGIVIGISDYADKAIKSLKYADDDAIMFCNFLKTQIVKPSDTGNIKLFINKKATAIPVFAEIEQITKKAKAGDTVYIYFSGHGEANNPDEIFLICNDAAKGAYAVGGGVLRVRDLKNRIKIMHSRKVKVVLITDACRSNEAMEEEYNLIFTNALNENSGEIQLTSCSPNEKSFEDKRWGNGHGVFTWYLMKGWMGLADKNNNNRVTFEELTNYIVQKVGDDTYDKITDTKLQIPSYCCSGFNNTLMAKVDPEVKKKLLESEETGDNTLYAALIPHYFSRGADDEIIEDSMTLVYYDRLNKMLEQEQFLEPDTNCAIYYFNRFKEKQKKGATLEESKLDLIAGMANKAQSYIQDYLRGNDSITLLEFSYASKLMNTSLSLMDTTNEVYKSMCARALFLEANSMMTTQNEMSKAFVMLDSSLKLEPNKAYVYYTKAKIYERFNIYFSKAEENYLKAIELAPRWIFPMIDLGSMYNSVGKYDKGAAYFNKAISIQPGPYIYTQLGHMYHFQSSRQEDSDSAIKYYNKALSLDSNYIDAILGLAVVHLDKSQVDESVAYYLKAMAKDTTYYFSYLSFADLFYDGYLNDNAERYYKKTIALKPDCIKAHWMLGNLYDFRFDDKVKAVEEYDKCLKIDYYYTKAYVNIGNIYIGTEQFQDAINFLKYPLTYDANYNPINLARVYINRAPTNTERNDYDSAKLWLDTANHYFPNEYYTHYLYGFYYNKLNDMNKSIHHYLESVRLNETYYHSWLSLGDDYYLTKNFDSALYCYGKARLISPDVEKTYKYIWDVYQYDLKDYRKASDAADTAIKHNVNKPYFFFLKTFTLLENKEYDEALVAIDSAIYLRPNYATYLYYKAATLCAMYRKDDALEWLKMSIDQGITLNRDDFYGGRFKNLEGNKKFEKMATKYLKETEKEK